MMCHHIKTAASLEMHPGCQAEVFDIATFGKEIHCPTLYFELFSTFLHTSVDCRKKKLFRFGHFKAVSLSQQPR